MSRKEAQAMLDNYENVTREDFKDGYIHTGLAKLPFNWLYSLRNGYHDGQDIKDIIDRNKKNIKNLYVHALIDLGMKVEELRLDIAFNEAIIKNNSQLLKIMYQEMEMRPIASDGSFDEKVMIEGYRWKNRYEKNFGYHVEGLFEDSYELRRKKNIYGNYIPPMKETPTSSTILEHTKKIIAQDEKSSGQVSIESIYKIVSNPDFAKIKDESLNSSGSRILHILAETPFDPNNKKEALLIRNIIKRCTEAKYNFNIEDDFFETAEDKAIEAENTYLAQLLSKRRTQ
ncbi:MAG: hypothetical protein NC191_03335 [Muribaculaceae bacterium]|nr:hypothetical protein [Muribaculaceae bacterium]